MSAEVLENMQRLNKEAGAKTLFRQGRRALLGGRHKITEAVNKKLKNWRSDDYADTLSRRSTGRQNKLDKMDKGIASSKVRDKAKIRLKEKGGYSNSPEAKAKRSKKEFIDSLLESPETKNAQNKLWKAIDPKSKTLRNPVTDKQHAKAMETIVKKQAAAIKKLRGKGYSAKEADDMVRKWTDSWTGTPGGSNVKKAVIAGGALSVPAVYGANQLASPDADTWEETKDATGTAVDDTLAGVGNYAKGIKPGEEAAAFDTRTTAQPRDLDIPEQKTEDKTPLLEHIKELLGTQSGYAGMGAVAGGLGAYGVQRATEDKNLSAEEKKALRKKQALITALSALAGGGIGAGAHYYKNKKASEDRNQLVSRIQADAQDMTDDELEHRIANIQQNKMLNKQASEEKAAIKTQLKTARKLGII